MAVHMLVTKTVDEYGAEEFALLCEKTSPNNVDISTMPRLITCKFCKAQLQKMGIETSWRNDRRVKIKDGRIIGSRKG